MSGVDEQLAGERPTGELVVELATRKARAVAPVSTGALVLGADSLLDLDGEALGKPGSPVVASRRWRAISGRRAVLCTGQVLIDSASGAEVAALSETTIQFATLDAEEIDAYVASGEPLEVAGAFTIDGRGAAFVERVEGDASAVVGLSIAKLRQQLAVLGVRITELWAPPS